MRQRYLDFLTKELDKAEDYLLNPKKYNDNKEDLKHQASKMNPAKLVAETKILAENLCKIKSNCSNKREQLKLQKDFPLDPKTTKKAKELVKLIREDNFQGVKEILEFFPELAKYYDKVIVCGLKI